MTVAQRHQAQQTATTRPAKSGFRWDLKRATQDDHDALDHHVSKLDLRNRVDLARFFQMHLISFQAMTDTRPDQALNAMIAALHADLKVLGNQTTAPPIAPLPAYHPIAGQYICSGSRMGTRVLRRRWQTATDADVRAASHYFELELPEDRAVDVWSDLDQVGPNSAAAKTIIADTKSLFSQFIKAYKITAPPTSAPSSKPPEPSQSKL